MHLYVPLVILPNNENKGEDMVSIMNHLQQYAPLVQQCEDHHIASIDEMVRVISLVGISLLRQEQEVSKKPRLALFHLQLDLRD